MCTEAEFLNAFQPAGPVDEVQFWQDGYGRRVQVIYSDIECVQVIRETDMKYCSAKKGFNKFGEFTLSFFLHIFKPVLD